MSDSSRVRVYMACSYDGFIAGPDGDLSFLHDPALMEGAEEQPSGALGFEDFMAQVGAMLMGRSTHDVVAAMGAWPYGETPVLVATRRELQPAAETVQAAAGDIGELVAQARELAGERDVYLDGGDLVRQALDAGLVDELCITWVPTLLGGRGVRLLDGLVGKSRLEFGEAQPLGKMLQVTARVLGPAE